MKDEQKKSHWRRLPHGFKGPIARWVVLVFALVLTSTASTWLGGTRADSVHTLWKQVPEAQVKLDDMTPLTWNIYQPVKAKSGKRKDPNLVLVLLGHRYLFLNLKAKRVYEVELSDIQKTGEEIETGDLAVKSRLIPTSNWRSRNVGPAELYRVKLGDYGRQLQLSLPHPFNPFVP